MNWNKIGYIMSLMEKEHILTSNITYHYLIGVKGHSGDIRGMEQIFRDNEVLACIIEK